ncbi:MAG: hypothetical protein RIS54_1643, partial [Verrucomicrobiota bacterium]
MSAAPKSRLGRGLGSLIAKAAPAAPTTPTKNSQTPGVTPAAPAGAPGYQEIAVTLVQPSPYQARKVFT